jgi:tetratricopeptide (TPR) repeat protein
MGPDHPLVAATLAARAQTLTETGDYSAALTAFNEALAMLKASGSPDGSTYQQARVGYGDLLTRIGRAGEAEAVLRPALKVLEEANAASHRGPAQAGRAALGRSLAAQGRFAEAADLLEGFYRNYRDHYGPEHPRTRKAEAALSDLRAKTGV